MVHNLNYKYQNGQNLGNHQTRDLKLAIWGSVQTPHHAMIQRQRASPHPQEIDDLELVNGIDENHG